MVEHPPTLFAALNPYLSITISTLFACTGVVLLLAFFVKRGLASTDGVIPEARFTLRNFLELLLEGIVSLMRDTIGPEWPKFLPLVGTLGFFILVSNLMGLIPGLAGPTGIGRVETALSWALLSFMVAEYSAFKYQGPLNYLKHLGGPIWWLWIIMLPVEIISHAARLLSLTVRLSGNMFADHTLVAVFMSLGFINFFVPSIFMGLGLFVAFLQAFIFSFLTIIYIGQAVEDAHH